MDKYKKYKYVLLAVIVAVGFFFRFYKLGEVPNSLNWDEVSWGYNAYSILQTGKDEYGVSHPLSFKAFGDYKQPVYVYIDTLPLALFGLNAFSVRFPSAFLGSLSIIFVYLLLKGLFRKEKFGEAVALTATFLFAVSPWSIQFSRVAFEANVGLFFVILGTWLYLKGFFEKKPVYLFSSLIPLAVSCYTYHSEKLFTPLFFVGLLLYSFSYLKKRKKLLLGLLIGFILLNSLWVIDARTTARGRSVLFTSDKTQILAHPTEEFNADAANHDKVGMLVHNRRLIYFNTYLKNYLLHFDPNFLFVTGGDASHHAPGMGMLYLVALPFIIWGGVLLIKHKLSLVSILFYWFLLGPVASALAVDAPNASRSMIILPTWDVFAAVGLVACFILLKKVRFGYLAQILILLLFFANIFYYAHQYFMHTNTDYSKYWQYGYKEAITTASSQKSPSQHIFFDPSIEQAYIFYLFYSKKSPAEYIASGGSSRTKQKCFMIDDAFFGECQEKTKPGDLYVSAKQPSGLVSLVENKKITYPNGETAVTIYTTK